MNKNTLHAVWLVTMHACVFVLYLGLLLGHLVYGHDYGAINISTAAVVVGLSIGYVASIGIITLISPQMRRLLTIGA